LTFGRKSTTYSAAAVELGMALLSTEALDFGHGDALHADGAQGFSHLVELEGLDDGRSPSS
jgi:hypothetical protein